MYPLQGRLLWYLLPSKHVKTLSGSTQSNEMGFRTAGGERIGRPYKQVLRAAGSGYRLALVLSPGVFAWGVDLAKDSEGFKVEGLGSRD